MTVLSDESLARLAAVPFFATLERRELERLASQARVVTAEPGEVLLREGALGDRMFVLEAGAVQVYTTGFDASDVVLARLGPGEWFGEQALLPGGSEHRNASVRALEDSRLLAISRDALLEALGQHSALMRRLRSVGEEQRTLRRARLRESVFSTLGVAAADSHRLESFAAGDVVFREGERGDRVYLVLRGRAQARRGDAVLSQLLPGQFFGELAILNDTPRTATVHAVEDLDTVSLDGEWFRSALRQTPALRSLMDSLSSMYLLPRRGVVTLQTGQVDGKSSVTAVHTLAGGRRVVCTRLADRAAFTAEEVGAGARTTARFEDAARAILRELGIAGGRLVQIDAEGEWTQLGETLGRLLDSTPVEEWQLALFRERGSFSAEDPEPLYEDREVICACTHTTCGQIMKAIAEDCHTLEALARRTNVTRVCGGCTPLVKELLGKSEWTPGRVVESVPLADDVRTFRVRPAAGGCRPYRAGQHVVLQARIDNRWIQRAYTLSAAPGTGDVYEVTVKREPPGVFSRWLFDRLRPDVLLRVSEPAGHYHLADDETRDVVCLVGGIGVTPALAMARALAARPRAHRLHVDYSVSDQRQVILRDELLGLRTRNPKISVRIRLTRRDGRFGAVDAKDLVREFPAALFYLCGSQAYMDAVAAHLRECGVSDERIRIEVFVVAGEKPVARPAAPPPLTCPVDHGRAAAPPATPLDQARQLLEQYYGGTRAMAAFAARWQQVEQEFRTTSTWRKTAEELGFAARVAWRNSTRCVGRLYWEGLALRDFRHVATGEGMLDAIMGHIEMATNGGSLRPVITVFPPRSPDGRGPRVWSPQLFRYAGYRAADGSVLGDPGNAELTEVAIGLGWRPPEARSGFDLLPVIVQAVGEPPTWREIPRALVLEIPIVHPQHAWFADLGLKWYALPAVSAMRLEAGGLSYPAAPFNGWYMGTEIGARNLADQSRYDMLPEIARRLGLDTRSDRTLWRDRALVELNVAVLASFDRAGVRMSDHHAESRRFILHLDRERRAGRSVPADWSWIVPPMSGSTTPVFHRYYDEAVSGPRYARRSPVVPPQD